MKSLEDPLIATVLDKGKGILSLPYCVGGSRRDGLAFVHVLFYPEFVVKSGSRH